MKIIGCVIPCYRGNKNTIKVIKDALSFVNYLVLVDDYCPNSTGEKASQKIKSKKFFVINNSKNLGVGASVKKGIDFLLTLKCDLIIKIDADGQINPNLIPLIIKPIIIDNAEAVKGNRFTDIESILRIPKLRLIGNLGLSFLNKLSSGYWELFDPTNGFIAFDTNALKRIRYKKLDNKYFFESSLLFECSLADISFAQIPIKSIYANEVSSLNPFKEILRFSYKHLINLIKRLIYQYLLLDFNAGSLELIGSFLSLILALSYFIFFTFQNNINNKLASPGEANLLALTLIISFQLLLSFIFYDATQKPLLRKLKK